MLGKKISLLLVAFLISMMGANAQDAGNASQGSYEAAVDGINCLTIKFIHKEQNRAELAGKMDCNSFEGIMSTIPEDERSTTGKLAEAVNAYKKKWDPAKSLDNQIDGVIAYALGRVKSRPRKGDIASLESAFIQQKNEAVAQSTITPAQESAMDEGEMEDITSTSESVRLTEPQSDGGDTLGWVGILLGLAALGLGLYNLLGVRAINKELAAKTAYLELEMNKRGAPMVSDSGNNYQLLSDRIGREVKELQNQIEELKGKAKTGFSVSTRPGAEAAQIMQAPPPKPAPVTAEQPFADPPVQRPQSLTPANYRYAKLPEGQRFMDAELTDNPQIDSVFEIELFPDIEGKAYFAPLGYPDVIRKMASQPDIYVAPFLNVNGDATGRALIVLEEGQLEKQGEYWNVVRKAKVRFES